MKAPRILMIVFMFLVSAASFAQTHIQTGNVSGTWTTAGSPYLIEGNISISSGQTLTLQPGVLVEFQGYYSLIVQGQLLAVGTKNDSIRFTIDDTTGFRNLSVPDGGWHGIRFGYSTPGDDTSRISFCKLEWGKAVGNSPENSGAAIAVESYDNLIISNSFLTHSIAAFAGGAIAILNSDIIVKNNTVYQNGAGFACGGIAVSSCDPQIINNKIDNNVAHSSGGGLGLSNGAKPNITNNIILNNTAKYGGGIQMNTNCNPLIRNNLIYNNTADLEGGGVDLEDKCNPLFVNNTIVYNSAPNGGGIDCEVNSDPIFRNTIIWWNEGYANGPQVHLFSEDSDPDFYYCDIQGGSQGFGLWYGGGTYFTYTGIYENNMDDNPNSTSQNNYLFLLSEGSPCIDAGDPDAIYNDLGDPAKPGFAKWPSKGQLRNDMGVYGGPGFLNFETITGVDDKSDLDLTNQQCQLFQNYPNPFTLTTTIAWHLSKYSPVILKVYDFTGREIETLANCEMSKGEHHVIFNADGFPAGVYYYQLRAGNGIVTRKMLIIK